MSSPVKGGPAQRTRDYDASGRRARARARRTQVLAAARELFLRDGFAKTKVAVVAETAGVSQETVYKTFGGKAGLIEALYRDALRGAEPVAAYERSDALRADPDPHRILRGWSRLATEVGPRVTAVELLVRDAALVDPTLRELLDRLDEDRLIRMTENATFLADAGHLRPGVGVAEAADLMWTLTAPEMLELLVQRRGWSLERYADFLYETMASGLLASPGRPLP